MSGQTEIMWEENASIERLKIQDKENEWKEYSLGNLVDFSSGGTPSKANNEFWDGGIPWISAKTMTWHKVSISDLNITEEALKNGSRIALAGDILLLVRGSGLFRDIPICLVEKPVAFNQDIKAIRAKDKRNQEFIYYWLHSSKKELYDILEETGIGAGKFDTELLKKLPVLLPTNSNEIQAIVDTAKAIFDKIDLLHRQNDTLEILAKTLFRQWFVEEAKEEWETTILNQHTEVSRGLSYKGSGLAEQGLGVPMHNLNSIFEGGGYKYAGIKFYNGDYKPRHLVFPGDIIVSNTEQGHEFKLIGFPAVVTDAFGELGLFSQHLYKIAPLESSSISREFLYYLLQSSVIREQIISATNGSTVNMLAIDGLQRPEFKIPPKELIEKFTLVISEYWRKKNVNLTQIRTLSVLRDTLLPKLMSGEVRVAY
jgi:type I restriction enzyme S subunit